MLTELARPLSDGFVGDDDAAGRQQLLNHAKPERETEIQPDGMADDLGREPIPGVAGASGCPHPTGLLTPICPRKRPAKLTVPARHRTDHSDLPIAPGLHQPRDRIETVRR